MSQNASTQSVKDFVGHRKVITLHPDAPIGQAARVMHERGIGSVLVADGAGNILGLVTDRDLACHGLLSAAGAQTAISEVMSARLIAVDEEARVFDVIKAMERNGIRRVPVLQRVAAGRLRCLGIITLDDLVAAGAVTAEQIAPVIRRQTVYHKMKSETHRQQTIRHFYRKINDTLKFPEAVTQQIVLSILSALVQRLPYIGAAHLLAQLPSQLQDDLLGLPPGPDRSITVETLHHRLMRDFGLEEHGARSILIKAFAALSECLDPGVIEHVKSQLPDEFRVLFTAPESTISRLGAA